MADLPSEKVTGGGGPLLRPNDGHCIGLPGGHVHLADAETKQKERGRERQVRH